MKPLFHDRGKWLYGGLVATTVLVCTLQVGWQYHESRWERALRSSNDANGYYEFLPAALVKHDLDAMDYAFPVGNGRRLNVYPIGVALFEAPFFLAAHTQILLEKGDATGWTSPYSKARLQATAFYCALGALLVFLSLRRRFGDPLSAVAALSVFAATNLLYYSAMEPGYSHAYSFFLFAALLWLSHRTSDRPRGRWVAAMIVCGALILLVRPANAPVLLYPILAGTTSWREVEQRLRDRFHERKAILAGLLIGLLCWAPQLWYWHHVTGTWLPFTYGLKGEGFRWGEFHGADVLFSHQNGWFIYSPFMLPVMVALIAMAWRRLEGARTILLIWTFAWLTYSLWWCWWLGGSFGFRGFIEFGALLAVPMAWGIEQALRRSWSSVVLAIIVVLGVHINMVFTELYDWPWEGETWTWERVRHIYAVAFLE